MNNRNNMYTYILREQFIPVYCFIYSRILNAGRMKHNAQELSAVQKQIEGRKERAI